jgi:hypothetical protein
VLDPKKIVGITESSATRGFGNPASDAELFYVRFPVCDLDKAMNVHSSAQIRNNERVGSLSISSGLNNDKSPNFEYCFDSQMHATQVLYDSQTPAIHSKLRSEKKITSTFDASYLENLRQGVEYWDGSGWQSNWTKVKH